MDELEGKKFKVMVFIKPSALELFEHETCPAAEGQGVKQELGIWFLRFGPGFEVEDMKKAVPDLQKIDVAGQGVLEIERYVKAELFFVVPEVFRGQVDWDFHGYGDGIVNQHELLQSVVSHPVVYNGLEDELGQAGGVAVPGFNPDLVKIQLKLGAG